MAGRFDESKRKFMFTDQQGNVLKGVNLVVVEGTYDNQKREFVDPPRVHSGFGWVRPERVANDIGCKL